MYAVMNNTGTNRMLRISNAEYSAFEYFVFARIEYCECAECAAFEYHVFEHEYYVFKHMENSNTVYLHT